MSGVPTALKGGEPAGRPKAARAPRRKAVRGRPGGLRPGWEEQQRRAALAAGLAAEVNGWRGDPRLTAWEEEFLTGIARDLQALGGEAVLTMRQRDKLDEILGGLARAPAEPAETDADLDDFDAEVFADADAADFE